MKPPGVSALWCGALAEKRNSHHYFFAYPDFENDETGTIENKNKASISNERSGIVFNKVATDTSLGKQILNADEASISNDGTFNNQWKIDNTNHARITNRHIFVSTSANTFSDNSDRTTNDNPNDSNDYGCDSVRTSMP